MMFHKDKNILVMATKQSTAVNIIRKIQVALKKIPQWLMLSQITADNKLSIELGNGSRIKAIASSDDAGRSEALSLLIIDEAAHIERLDDLWTGLLPTVTAGGKVIVLSTPNGVGNLFHRLYSESESGLNDFNPTKLMWWSHPERVADLVDDPNRPGFKTSSWYRAEVKATNMSPRDIAQELECNFNASGDTVLSSEAIEWIEGECVTEPISREAFDRNLFVWHEPMRDVNYLLSADVARGDGKDFSGFHIFEPNSMVQVAEYCGKVKPDQFAKIIDMAGRKYNDALAVVENNNIGMSCLRDLQLLEYPNVYFSRRGDTKNGEAVNMAFGSPDPDLIPGFTTSPKTRPLIVAKLEEYFRNHTVTINSRRLLGELRTFIWHNGKPEAMRGYNDDLTMAAAMGVWIRETFLSTEVTSAAMQEKMVLGISLMGTKNTDIAGASKDPRFQRQNQLTPMGRPVDPMKVTLPNGHVVDMSWIISKG